MINLRCQNKIEKYEKTIKESNYGTKRYKKEFNRRIRKNSKYWEVTLT